MRSLGRTAAAGAGSAPATLTRLHKLKVLLLLAEMHSELAPSVYARPRAKLGCVETAPGLACPT
jgi:hypothetical protein